MFHTKAKQNMEAKTKLRENSQCKEQPVNNTGNSVIWRTVWLDDFSFFGAWENQILGP